MTIKLQKLLLGGILLLSTYSGYSALRSSIVSGGYTFKGSIAVDGYLPKAKKELNLKVIDKREGFAVCYSPVYNSPLCIIEMEDNEVYESDSERSLVLSDKEVAELNNTLKKTLLYPQVGIKDIEGIEGNPTYRFATCLPSKFNGQCKHAMTYILVPQVFSSPIKAPDGPGFFNGGGTLFRKHLEGLKMPGVPRYRDRRYVSFAGPIFGRNPQTLGVCTVPDAYYKILYISYEKLNPKSVPDTKVLLLAWVWAYGKAKPCLTSVKHIEELTGLTFFTGWPKELIKLKELLGLDTTGFDDHLSQRLKFPSKNRDEMVAYLEHPLVKAPGRAYRGLWYGKLSPEEYTIVTKYARTRELCPFLVQEMWG